MTDRDATVPAISVLMVNWNTRELTLAALRSLFASDSTFSFEVILVDNGSIDGSADAIAEQFPRVDVIREDKNLGFAAGTNLAAGRAAGERLLLLNTDTLVRKGALDALLTFAEQEPQARIWGGRTVFVDGSLNSSYAWQRISVWSSFCIAAGLTALARGSTLLDPEAVGAWGAGTKREVDIVSGCFFLIDAALWRTLGGFDQAFFMYGEEADLCARARAEGAKPMVTPEAVIVHHGGGSVVRRADSIVQVQRARIELMRRHLGGVRGWLAPRITWIGILWRRVAFGIAAGLTGTTRHKEARDRWACVWSRRNEWMQGYAGGRNAR